MAFSDFDLRTALLTLGLQEDRGTDIFPGVPPVEPNAMLRLYLDRFALMAIGINTEKARSEFIIAPLLAEAMVRSRGPAAVLPGVMVDADKTRGLIGYCDFVISGSEEYYFLKSPLMAVVEAKREDIVGGLGQCAAAMVGIAVFNEKDGTPVPAVYGCVTSGNVWRFLRLVGTTLSIDRREYYLQEAPTILGIFVQLMGGPVAAQAA